MVMQMYHSHKNWLCRGHKNADGGISSLKLSVVLDRLCDGSEGEKRKVGEEILSYILR